MSPSHSSAPSVSPPSAFKCKLSTSPGVPGPASGHQESPPGLGQKPSPAEHTNGRASSCRSGFISPDLGRGPEGKDGQGSRGTGAGGRGDLAKAGQGYHWAFLASGSWTRGTIRASGTPGKPVSVLRPPTWQGVAGEGQGSPAQVWGEGGFEVRFRLHTSFLRAALEPFRVWKAAQFPGESGGLGRG